MKQTIFERADGFYMTPSKNYYAYVQNARQIHKLEGVNSWEDVAEMIEKMCAWYQDKPENYEIARW